MRISTMQMNNTMLNNMMSTSSSMNKLLIQLSTGKAINKPSDDTLAALQIFGLKDSNEALSSYAGNIKSAGGALALAETTVTDMGNVLNRMRDLVLGTGGTPTPYTEGKGSAQIQELEGLVESLMNLANTRSSSGEYIFGGTKGDTPPIRFNQQSVPHQFSVGGSASARRVKISDSQEVNTGVVAGDLFTLNKSKGGNIFDAMKGFIDKMRDKNTTDAEKKELRADALKALDETLDNMNGALTHIGGVQNTLELAMNANSDRQLQNQSLISGLEDVDFASAVTKFTMMQAQSQASHKAFAMVGRASLFDYI